MRAAARAMKNLEFACRAAVVIIGCCRNIDVYNLNLQDHQGTPPSTSDQSRHH